MNKKAQAAMEFLMTYGWAILVVLLAIAALAYFGVLNPGRFLPSSCTFNQPGISCNDFKVDEATDTITLVVQNGIGKDLPLVHVHVAGVCGGTATETVDGTLGDTEIYSFSITCSDLAGLSKVKEPIYLWYTSPVSEGGIQHNISGQLSASVE